MFVVKRFLFTGFHGRKSEIDALFGKEFVVEVVFDFVHVGSDVGQCQELVGEITAGQAQAGLGVVLLQQCFQLGFGQQAVVDGIVDLIADYQVVVAASRQAQSFFVCFQGSLLVLFFADEFGADGAGVIKTLAAFIEVQLVFVDRHDVADKDMLADAPVLDELDIGDFPAVAQSTHHHAEAGAGLAFAVAGVDHDDRVFCLIVLKCHYQSVWRLSWRRATFCYGREVRLADLARERDG